MYGETEAVRLSWLLGFFGSGLGKRALAADTLHREWAFNLRGDGQTLVQGVIDLCFLEADGWVLVDYKTDAARDVQAVLDRHRPQLALYQEALEELTGIPVAERLLWLVRAQAAYRV